MDPPIFSYFPCKGRKTKRLSEKSLSVIKQAVRKNFGSRVDDAKLGGDIDLLIESSLKGTDLIRKKLQTMSEVQIRLGDQKIDMIIYDPESPEKSLVVEEAYKNGIKIS